MSLANRMHKVNYEDFRSQYHWMFSQSALEPNGVGSGNSMHHQAPYHNALYHKWEYVTFMKIECTRYDDFGNIVNLKESGDWSQEFHQPIWVYTPGMQGFNPFRHIRQSSESAVLEETLFISPSNQVGINTNIYETINKTIQYDHDEEIARIVKVGDKKLKVEFEQPHVYSRNWNKDIAPKDFITIEGQTLKAISYENIDLNSYFINTELSLGGEYDTYD